jgi:predicted transcriptional regulator YheO
MGLLEKALKSSSNLIIDGAPKEEVLLCINLMKMEKLADHVPMGNVVVNSHLKTTRTNPKMSKENLESMHRKEIYNRSERV